MDGSRGPGIFRGLHELSLTSSPPGVDVSQLFPQRSKNLKIVCTPYTEVPQNRGIRFGIFVEVLHPHTSPSSRSSLEEDIIQADVQWPKNHQIGHTWPIGVQWDVERISGFLGKRMTLAHTPPAPWGERDLDVATLSQKSQDT